LPENSQLKISANYIFFDAGPLNEGESFTSERPPS